MLLELNGIYIIIRADILSEISIFRNQINLWHSTPIKRLKKFELDNNFRIFFINSKQNFTKNIYCWEIKTFLYIYLIIFHVSSTRYF